MLELKTRTRRHTPRRALPTIALAVALGLLIGMAVMRIVIDQPIQITAATTPPSPVPGPGQWITDPEAHSAHNEILVAPPAGDAQPGQVLPGPPPPPSEFGDGTFTVWTDISPGTYRSTPAPSGGSPCTWQRLSGFTGAADEVIASGVAAGDVQTVVISPTDQMFHSQACTLWQRVN
ncbi:hypothetical protein [Mycolicibacterium komossense]|uniref:Uncharacterized protein n=1 Tax=Mycolicibacterium komossense TaxID=1779 RepID=A0ABT3CHV7_9MYCO|nr:hypothetical protein [Mycolicibacterium komossense]MCV7229080.1 hypothetical protein [Mycolicibacterium komossense]